jgi:lactoylglutathione lyase
MPNVHVHLHVADLARSRDFYRRFLGVDPVKDKPDYLKFLPPQAALNLAMTHGRPAPDGGHHGLQLDSVDAVGKELARVRAAGLDVRVQENVDC